MKMFNSRKGFTLTELMVVVLIMAILMSVAIPVFLASRDRAIARAAQARLRNGATAAKEMRAEDWDWDDNAATPDAEQPYDEQTKDMLDDEAKPIDFFLQASSPAEGDAMGVYVITGSTTATTMALETRDANGVLWRAEIDAEGAVTLLQPEPTP